MKKILLLVLTSLIGAQVWANDVTSINGQKVVLFKLPTVLSLDEVFKSNPSNEQAAMQIQQILKSEVIEVTGGESYCDTASKVYATRNSSHEDTKAKCLKILTSKFLPKDMAADRPEYNSLIELQESASAYVALLILME